MATMLSGVYFCQKCGISWIQSVDTESESEEKKKGFEKIVNFENFSRRQQKHQILPIVQSVEMYNKYLFSHDGK